MTEPCLMLARIVFALSLAATATTISAQISEVTPFVALQTGGSIVLDNRNTSLDASAAGGVFVTFDRGIGRKLDLLVSHQSTRAGRNDPFEVPLSADVSVDYFQLGGRYVLYPDRRVAPYVGGTFGGSLISAESSRSLLWSFAIGGGADLTLSSGMALRFDGRVYSTIGIAHAEVDCQSTGSCTGFSAGSSLTQFTASAGLVFKLGR